jgi:hypothetical protein
MVGEVVKFDKKSDNVNATSAMIQVLPDPDVNKCRPGDSCRGSG